MEVHEVYSLREKFTVIALTGRTGSGCSTISETLSKEFHTNENIFPDPGIFKLDHNAYRKYRIIYNYSAINFKPYKVIKYKDILVAFILKYKFKEFKTFLKSRTLKSEFEDSNLKTIANFSKEINSLTEIQETFRKLHSQVKDLINAEQKTKNQLRKIFEIFESEDFKSTSKVINEILSSNSLIKRNKTLQIIANNLRKYGHPYKEHTSCTNKIFTIAEFLNDYIKAIKDHNNEKGKNTEIVIDTLRNPFEIMFFKQRYRAYYTFAVSRSEAIRKDELKKRYQNDNFSDIEILLNEEYSGAKNGEFYKQNVSACIQNADVHLAFESIDEVKEKNEKKDNTASPFFSWGMQLLKFISLIDHPGIITPSPEERCMQFAYTAKYNSGCISRQVGAAISDEFYSLKAIGWNNTPEGHVPCNLRSVEDYLNEQDFDSFTPYEREYDKFKETIIENYKSQVEKSKSHLKGRNVSYCFKTLINSYTEGKNQVHTRSLHAEENAFLQISKYGGTGIKNGKLFATASPCELCSKKAFQLGIDVIYYIDPYPGIAEEHILKAGTNKNPKLRLFSGAIGAAYNSLYEPLMPYKDELAVILGHEIIDLTKKFEDLATKLKLENKNLKSEIKRLKLEFNQLSSANTE